MGKSWLTRGLVIIALLFCCQMSARAGQNSAATVHIDLDTTTAGTQTTRVAAVNDTFDVDVVINGAVNLKTFNLVVTFPEAILEIQDAGVTEGDFLSKNGAGTFFTKDVSTAGKAEVTCVVLGTITDEQAADGDGVLAHLSFKALSTQQADLAFSTSGSDTQLLRDNNGDIDDPVALGNANGAIVNPQPTTLAFLTSPGNSSAESNLAPNPRVAVQNDLGNTVTSSTALITVAIKTGTGAAGATLSGTTAVNAANGVATFADLSIDTKGEDYQLTATSAGLTPADSNTFDVGAGSATKLAFIAQPEGPYQAGQPINAIPEVAVQDASGNTVTSSSAEITIQIGTNPGGGTLSGTTVRSAANGVASFPGLSIDKKGNGYTLRVTSTGLTSADSDAFDVTHGSATKLDFITSPSDTAAMGVLSPDPQVAVQDASGNTVTDSNAPVTVEIKAGTGTAGATLSGTATVNAVNGVATFNDLKINRAGDNYQLTAGSAGLLDADSQTFDITAEPALTIEKSDDADPVDPNDTVVYTITYGNAGLADAHNTVIVETLPADLIYVSSAGGGVYNDTAKTITWTIGTQNAEDVNDTVTFTATVANSDSILEGGTITNSDLTIDCDEKPPKEQTTPETTDVNDIKAPETSGHIPEPNSIQVLRDTIIQVHITDGGSGVEYDGGTVTIQIEGDLVYDGANETSPGVYDSNSAHPGQTVRGVCRRTGTAADYTFVFQPSTLFDYEQKVDVTVNAADEAGNVMPEETYHFYTVMRSFGRNIKVNSDTGALVQNRPATATDSAGNIWVVWDQTTVAGDTDIYIGQLEVGAYAFGASMPVVSNPNSQSSPAIAIDGSDVIYATWQERNPADPNSNWNIFFSTSTTADPNTWTAPVQIDPNDANQLLPAIAIDGTGKMYVVWEDERAGNNKDIWVASSTNGTTWTPTQITTHASDQTEPAIVINHNVACVGWTDARNTSTDLYGAASEHAWEIDEVVTTTSDQSSPALAADPCEVVHCLWVDNATGGYDDIFYDMGELPLTGTSIIDEPNTVQSHPDIAVTGTDNSTKVFACWEDYRNVVNNNGDTDIYFAESGSDFGTNILVNDDTGANTQTDPAIGTDKNGNPYIVWVDDGNGNNDIYYAGATSLGPPLATEDVNAVIGGTVADSNSNVSVDIEPNSVPSDVTVEIRRIYNLPETPSGGFGVPYDFGPSGLEFDPPATITIRHAAGECPGYSVWRVYWYDSSILPPASPWRQDGISDVEHLTSLDDPNLPADKHAIRFKSTHFTPFGQGGSRDGDGDGGRGWGGGGAGCSMSPHGQGSVAGFMLPYAAFIIVLLAVSCVDARRRRNKCDSQ